MLITPVIPGTHSTALQAKTEISYFDKRIKSKNSADLYDWYQRRVTFNFSTITFTDLNQLTINSTLLENDEDFEDIIPKPLYKSSFVIKAKIKNVTKVIPKQYLD